MSLRQHRFIHHGEESPVDPFEEPKKARIFTKANNTPFVSISIIILRYMYLSLAIDHWPLQPNILQPVIIGLSTAIT